MNSFIQLTRISGFGLDLRPITVRTDAISTIEPRFYSAAKDAAQIGTTLVLHPDAPAIDVVEPYRTVRALLKGPRNVCPDCGDIFNTNTGTCMRCDNLEVDKTYENMRGDLIKGAV